MLYLCREAYWTWKCHNGSLVGREQTLLFPWLLACSPRIIFNFCFFCIFSLSVHATVAAFFSWSSMKSLSHQNSKWKKNTHKWQNWLRTDVQPTEHCKSLVVSGSHWNSANLLWYCIVHDVEYWLISSLWVLDLLIYLSRLCFAPERDTLYLREPKQKSHWRQLFILKIVRYFKNK